MRSIKKKVSEPESLTWQRAQENACYDNLDKDVRRDLKISLLEEQGYTCCYCMQRISFEKMKIEHYLCQRNNADKDLEYKNMLASCMGNEGRPYKFQHCDSYKKDKNLNINMLSGNINDKIKYHKNGEIYSEDNVINDALGSVLNLNCDYLKRNRKIALNALIERMTSKNRNKWKISDVDRILRKYEMKDGHGKFKEYYGMFIYVLNKKKSKL